MSRIRDVVLVLATLAFVSGCQDTPTAVDDLASVDDAAPATAKSNAKFTFTDVTLDDGTVVVEDGVIEASSRDKKNDRQDWTECTYYTEGWSEHLGGFGSDDFASTDAQEVLDFCREHFADRT